MAESPLQPWERHWHLGSTAGQQAGLTPTAPSAAACQELVEAGEAFRGESQQLAFAACPSRPAGSLGESAGAVQSTPQLGLQRALRCCLLRGAICLAAI